MSLNARPTGPADIVISDGPELVTEIRGLQVVAARFRPGGRFLIGETVPLSLFWMQYANHQDPERNTGARGTISVLSNAADTVILRCSGTTASGACFSTVLLSIERKSNPDQYVYSVDTKLDIVSKDGWFVTPNPTQGEVEFANVWPDETFSPLRNNAKRYGGCYVLRPTNAEKIPHHHLESSDKHNIKLHQGDRFLYLLDDENPQLLITSAATVTAGVCAYMWDVHFAYKVCSEGKALLLPSGTHLEAKYSLSSLARDAAKQIVDEALDRDAPELDTIPLYVNGVNRFSETVKSIGMDWRYAWPWEPEGSPDSTLAVDRSTGYDDTSSLRIDSRTAATSMWKATTLGPAFGGEAFKDRSRYRLTAFVKTAQLRGKASIAVRLHRHNEGSVFDIKRYELFLSGSPPGGDSEWTKIDITTPTISPAPDRLHLLLIQEGEGTTWFDNVLLEELS